MRNKITMEMSICQAENGFSLDELVKKLADAFENKAFADILKMNLQLTQEVLMYRIFNNSSSQQCCPDELSKYAMLLLMAVFFQFFPILLHV